MPAGDLGRIVRARSVLYCRVLTDQYLKEPLAILQNIATVLNKEMFSAQILSGIAGALLSLEFPPKL